MTVREAIEAIGLRIDQLVIDPGNAHALDWQAPRIRWAATGGTGALQVCCGGDVLVTFGRPFVSPVQPGIVRDDREGEAWDAARFRGENPVATRPRPHAVLRFVVMG